MHYILHIKPDVKIRETDKIQTWNPEMQHKDRPIDLAKAKTDCTCNLIVKNKFTRVINYRLEVLLSMFIECRLENVKI